MFFTSRLNEKSNKVVFLDSTEETKVYRITAFSKETLRLHESAQQQTYTGQGRGA